MEVKPSYIPKQELLYSKGPPQLKKTHFFQFLAEIFLTPPPYDFQFPIVKFTQNPDAG